MDYDEPDEPLDKPTLGKRAYWAAEDLWYDLWESFYNALDWVGSKFDSYGRLFPHETKDLSSFSEGLNGDERRGSRANPSYFGLIDMGAWEEQSELEEQSKDRNSEQGKNNLEGRAKNSVNEYRK